MNAVEELPDECEAIDCGEIPQRVVELDVANEDPQRFAVCMLCVYRVLQRDTAGNVTVVGP